MDYKLVIEGPLMGAVRTTQRQKWVDPRYKLYEQFKNYVRLLGNQARIPDTLSSSDKVFVRFNVYWTKRARIDADNIIKGVLDALWPNDRRVLSLWYETKEEAVTEHAEIFIKCEAQ